MKKNDDTEIFKVIGDLRDLMVEKFDQVDSKFDQVDARFEQIDARFEQVDSRFNQVDARFDQVDARFSNVDDRLGRVENRLDKLEQNQNIHLNVLDKHTKMLMDIKQEQAFALHRQERIEKDVLMLKKKLKAT